MPDTLFQKLRDPIFVDDEDGEYDKIAAKLLSGDWRPLQKLCESPRIVFSFPGALPPRVAIVPATFEDGLQKHIVLLETSWSVGISPRPMQDQSKRTWLRFVAAPLAGFASRPPSLDVLESAAQLTTPPSLIHGPELQEVQVGELVAELSESYGVAIQPHPHLHDQYALLQVKSTEQVCLTELLDMLAASIRGVWDWSCDRVLLNPAAALQSTSSVSLDEFTAP